MTNYIITEAQLKMLVERIKFKELTKVTLDMLQSLPEVQPTVTQSEPVAYMFQTDEGIEIGGLAPLPSNRDLLEIDKQGVTVIPLYTSPKLTPITANDVTDEMVTAYLAAQRASVDEADRLWGRVPGGGLRTNTVKSACQAGLAAAYNAVIKHRSEVK